MYAWLGARELCGRKLGPTTDPGPQATGSIVALFRGPSSDSEVHGRIRNSVLMTVSGALTFTTAPGSTPCNFNHRIREGSCWSTTGIAITPGLLVASNAENLAIACRRGTGTIDVMGLPSSGSLHSPLVPVQFLRTTRHTEHLPSPTESSRKFQIYPLNKTTNGPQAVAT